MMGPSKACVADTPRLARCRTSAAMVCERAWSQYHSSDRSVHHIFLPLLQISPGVYARWVLQDRLEDDHVPRLLPHAPLLN